MLLNLLANYESLFCENISIKVILEGCPDAYTRRTWREDVKKFLNDPKLMTSAHAVFAPFYEQINEATDEADLLEVLLKLSRLS